MQEVGKTEKILIKNIEALMAQRNWKPKDLSNATGLSLQWAYNTLNGDRFPGPDNLDRLAAAFNKKVSDLFSEHEEQKQISPHEALRIIQQHLDNEKHQIFREKHKKNEIQNPALSELVTLLSSLDDEEISMRLDELKAFLRVRDEALVEDEKNEPIVKRRKL